MSPRLILGLAAAAVLATAIGGFYLKARQDGADAEKPKTELAQDDAAARGLEAGGEIASAQRVEVVVRQAAAAQADLSQFIAESRSAPDADTPMDADRLSRLRAHDRRVCDRWPALGGCAEGGRSAPGDAAAGAGTLPPDPVPY